VSVCVCARGNAVAVAAAVATYFWFSKTSSDNKLRLRIVAICKRAFFVVSPTVNEGDVFDGGCVRRVMMSDAACWMKSSTVILGNGICFGKNTTVSVLTSARVVGI